MEHDYVLTHAATLMSNQTKYSADELDMLKALSAGAKQQHEASTTPAPASPEPPKQQRTPLADIATDGTPTPLPCSEIETACHSFDAAQCIGSGGTATVYLAKAPERQLAVKLLKSGGDHQRNLARKEIALLAMCHHPHIQQCFGFCLEPKLCVVYPAICGGTVRDRIITSARGEQLLDNAPLVERTRSRLERIGIPQPSPPLAWHRRLCIVRDVASALLYLHAPDTASGKPSIFHSDLTSDNVLVTVDGRAIIHDMGYSRVYVKPSTGDADVKSLLARCGMSTLATELRLDSDEAKVHVGLAHGEEDGGADVVMLGCVLMELATSWAGPELTGPVDFDGKRIKSHRDACDAVQTVARSYPVPPSEDKKSGLMPLPGLDPDAQWPMEIARSTVPSLLRTLNSFQAFTKPTEVLLTAVKTIDAVFQKRDAAVLTLTFTKKSSGGRVSLMADGRKVTQQTPMKLRDDGPQRRSTSTSSSSNPASSTNEELSYKSEVDASLVIGESDEDVLQSFSCQVAELTLDTDKEKQWKQIGSDPKGLRLQVQFVRFRAGEGAKSGFGVTEIRATIPVEAR